jgi:GNAT superfamily N-acetyltransferase
MSANHGSKNPDAVNLAKAYESNLRAYTIAMAEAGDGFVQRDKDAILTAFPYTYWINGVVSPCLSPFGTLERVNEILAVFRRLGRGVWFTLGPSTEPADLAKTLKKRRLWNTHNRPFMACNLTELVTGFPQPPGVSVRPVEDYDIFYQHPHPLLKRITTPRTRHIFQTFKRLAQEQPRKHWMFIAERDDKPVGTAIIYFSQDNAGIYDVEVLDEFQGQGIGTALLQRVCICAQEQGAKLAVLAASEQGVGFYARFGFEPVGRYPIYYYSIKKQKEDAARVRTPTTTSGAL